MDGSDRECEIKLPFPSADAARRAIDALGATPARARHFEDNVAYDRDGALVEAGMLLRLRRNDRGATLTMKCPVEQESRHKVRDEFETALADPAAFERILDRLGYAACYRYQKYRTVFTLDDLELVLDETPIGCFVELEGPPASIDRVALRMGFTPDAYVRESYRELHERTAPAGTEPGDMLLR